MTSARTTTVAASGNVTVTVTVQKYTNALSWNSSTPAANATLTYGTSYTAKVAAATNGGTNGAITYSSNNTDGATINSSSGAITVVNGNAKAVTITASMAGTTTVKAATTTRAFTTGKATGYVNLSATSGSVTYGTASKTFTVSSSHGGTLSVSDNNDTATCSISGTTVTCSSLASINAGTSITVTVKSAATDNYTEATKTYTLSITKAACKMTVSNAEMFTGATLDLTTKTSSAVGTVSYAIKTNGTTTASALSGTNNKTLTAGAMSSANDTNQSVVVTATEAASTNYSAKSGSTNATIGKADGFVTLDKTTGSISYGTASKTFEVKTNHGGTLSVSDNNATAECTISGTTVTLSNLEI
jgi:hypothetical protein